MVIRSTLDANGRAPAVARHLPLDNRTLSQILDLIPLGILVVDASGTPCYSNAAATSLLGIDADPHSPNTDPVETYPVFEVGTGELYPIDRMPMMLAIRGQQSHIDDVEIRGPDGPTEMEIWGAPVNDERGQPTHGIAIFADISERRRAEAVLTSRVEERDRLNTELRRSNTELDQFAHVASHDLAEPLRSISGFVQLLARRYEDELDEDAHHFIRRVVEGTDRMYALIAAVLAYSRVGRATERFAPVDCAALMATTIEALQATLIERDARVVVGPLPTVYGDASQLAQVFQNLLANAIKFVPVDVSPRIEIEANRSNGLYEFSLRDNGLGIDEQYRARIFGMFQRLNRREDYAGTGIGLAICQKVVELHGGTIWVADSNDVGADFRFTLPIMRGDHD